MSRVIFKEYLTFSVKKFLDRKREALSKKDQINLVIFDNFQGHCFEDEELREIEEKNEC